MRTRVSIGLLVATLALAACGQGTGDATSTGSVPEAQLLSFEAETLGGDRVEVDDYAGSDLVIWFWAPW